MFKRPTILVLICFSVLLTACANKPNKFWYTSTDQLIEKHLYEQAIHQIIAETPVNEALLLKVKSLAAQHLKIQTQKINQLVAQKKWGEARGTLNKLNLNQPSSTSFDALNTMIDKAQREEVRIIDTRQALLEAQLLDIQFIQKDLSKRIRHHRSDWFSNDNDLMVRKKALAETLLHLSTQALFMKDYKNAQKAYKKAIELDHTLKTTEITQAINAGLNNKKTKAINERKKSLIKKMSFAISTDNFESILKIERILSHKSFHDHDVDKVLSIAKKKRIEHAKALDDTASEQYRSGNISLAVTQWQQAIRLDPDNIKIQGRLTRALKVQHKLKKLTATKEN